MGQKSRVGISVHAHECREKHFQQSSGDRLNIVILWILERKFLLFMCLGEGEYRSFSHAFAISSFESTPWNMLNFLTFILWEKEWGHMTQSCSFYTREKVNKVGIIMRSKAIFCRESKYWTWLNTSRMLVQGAGYLAAVSGAYIPAGYPGFIVLIEGSVQLQRF